MLDLAADSLFAVRFLFVSFSLSFSCLFSPPPPPSLSTSLSVFPIFYNRLNQQMVCLRYYASLELANRHCTAYLEKGSRRVESCYPTSYLSYPFTGLLSYHSGSLNVYLQVKSYHMNGEEALGLYSKFQFVF